MTEAKRVELFAWVEFTQQSTIERAEALLALRRLAGAFPGVVDAA